MVRFANRVKNKKGGVVGFGLSFGGPSYMVVGRSPRQFSSMLTLNMEYKTFEELIPYYQEIAKDFKTALSSIPITNSFDKFADSADSVLNGLDNVSF